MHVQIQDLLQSLSAYLSKFHVDSTSSVAGSRCLGTWQAISNARFTRNHSFCLLLHRPFFLCGRGTTRHAASSPPAKPAGWTGSGRPLGIASSGFAAAPTQKSLSPRRSAPPTSVLRAYVAVWCLATTVCHSLALDSVPNCLPSTLQAHPYYPADWRSVYPVASGLQYP